MVAALILISLVLAVGGLLFLSQATAGVGVIAFACLLAIYARIAQADAHRRPRKAAEESEWKERF